MCGTLSIIFVLEGIICEMGIHHPWETMMTLASLQCYFAQHTIVVVSQ